MAAQPEVKNKTLLETALGLADDTFTRITAGISAGLCVNTRGDYNLDHGRNDRPDSTMANFNPDRGLTRSILGRAGYTIDPNRNLSIQTAIRQNGKGIWAKFEYSQAFGQHWRWTGGLTIIRGTPSDFLGQYRRNSYGLIAVKYSF